MEFPGNLIITIKQEHLKLKERTIHDGKKPECRKAVPRDLCVGGMALCKPNALTKLWAPAQVCEEILSCQSVKSPLSQDIAREAVKMEHRIAARNPSGCIRDTGA